MSKVKICGLTRPEDITIVNYQNPDYIGFVFAKSRRQITPEQAKTLKVRLHPSIKSTGVFVDASIPFIISLVNEHIIDMVQLHGTEEEDYIRQLKKNVSCPVIKAIRVQNTSDILKAQSLSCDYLLLDTYVKGEPGGSGKTFDWSLIPKGIKPYFLAGGLTMENVGLAISCCHPYCVDVSSGVETEGIKNNDKIAAFMHAVNKEE